MTTDTTQASSAPQHASRRVETAFPWLSTLIGLLIISWYLLHLDPALQGLIRALPEPMQAASTTSHTLLAVLYALCLLWDGLRYWRRRQAIRAGWARLEVENRDLWQYRHQLQVKARTYAGHADKLKRFISDKLLEYIEYDEKFLHFQSIAAEVRHNGVIAFDTVQSALVEAQREETDTVRHRATDAEHRMRYLWDLLDLATTDNLSLHIANLQATCEELYYQKDLNPDDPEAQTADYSPRLAVWRAAKPLFDQDTDTEAIAAALADDNASVHLDTDPNVRLSLAPTGNLLGKANHLTLLLDNLLKNAQFYTQKRPYRHRQNRVSVALDEVNGQARLRVHNRGPHISDADQAQLFQLGFSTRRVKENHGKGLGLFFVHEIVKGYDGSIQVRNVDNQARQWHLRITLDNGDVVNKTVRVVLDQGQPKVSVATDADQGRPEKSQAWSLRRPVTQIEVRGDHQGSPHTFSLNDLNAATEAICFDPFQPQTPRWLLALHPRKRGARLVFEPLDLRGVEFTVYLPTARARLDSVEGMTEGDTLDDIDNEVARLNEAFPGFDD